MPLPVGALLHHINWFPNVAHDSVRPNPVKIGRNIGAEMDAIDQEFTNTLLRLSLVSEVPATQVARVRGRGQADGDRPYGPRATAVERLRDRYNAATGDRARAAVLRDARAELQRALVSPPAPDAEEWERKVAADPRPSRTVAEEHGISHTRVLELRREYPDAR
jgi:hypothetical protein